ncbi:LytR/AlgR family response regulator transcription factor [Haliscomenobacter sp.]|jgi:two-component system, LytTR family, response regulator LytT|uniref:LytR/AlgR family response regulator transcription factor n=1 Tax=Haliscomenobacter sp. TaxID=2717303 RepID=UPI003BAC4982
MRILIIEDELPAARRIEQLIRQQRPQVEILAVIDSISEAVKWFAQNPAPELILMDIHLADGLSFDIFQSIKIQSMVIFTTAYDQYAIRAFKVNSIDYLLKPIDALELKNALDKYDQVRGNTASFDYSMLNGMLDNLKNRNYRERFLVKFGNAFTYIQAQEMRFCYAEDSLVFTRLADGKKYSLDHTLEQLEQLLNPTHFFRINRKILLHIDAVDKIHPYFNNRLKLELQPSPGFEIVVSRERVQDFKNWIDQ